MKGHNTNEFKITNEISQDLNLGLIYMQYVLCGLYILSIVLRTNGQWCTALMFPNKADQQTVILSVIWDALELLRRPCNDWLKWGGPCLIGLQGIQQDATAFPWKCI